MIIVRNGLKPRVLMKMTNLTFRAALTAARILAAGSAALLTGCYVPGGGWTLRAGCDLREHKKPAIYLEMVDTHWDEQRRVAAFNAVWGQGVGTVTPGFVPPINSVPPSGGPLAPAPTIRPPMPLTPQPAAPLTCPGNLVPPPLPPADATVEPAVTHAAAPQRLVLPRLETPSCGETMEGQAALGEQAAELSEEAANQAEPGAIHQLAEGDGNITLSAFHVLPDPADSAQPSQGGSGPAARHKAHDRRAPAYQLFRRPAAR
jgi:hypothetical protein